MWILPIPITDHIISHLGFSHMVMFSRVCRGFHDSVMPHPEYTSLCISMQLGCREVNLQVVYNETWCTNSAFPFDGIAVKCLKTQDWILLKYWIQNRVLNEEFLFSLACYDYVECVPNARWENLLYANFVASVYRSDPQRLRQEHVSASTMWDLAYKRMSLIPNSTCALSSNTLYQSISITRWKFYLLVAVIKDANIPLLSFLVEEWNFVRDLVRDYDANNPFCDFAVLERHLGEHVIASHNANLL
jgi:hypothetical protein